MEQSPFEKKWNTPDEELKYLRERVRSIETGLGKEAPPREAIIKNEIQKFPEKELPYARGYEFPAEVTDRIVLKLAPESHDTKMEELLGILIHKGLKNALSVLEALENPHLEDDFHRFLVQYIASGVDIPELGKDKELWKATHMQLFEITFPEDSEQKSFKEVAALMEQFYAGMLSIAETSKNSEGEYFSLEIAVSHMGDEITFYAGVPTRKADLFEKQIVGLYPKAKVVPHGDDYNIYNESGASMAAEATSALSYVYPIRTYDQFDADPMDVIVSSFTKLKKEGEGLALQILVRPAGDTFIKKIGKILEEVKRGTSTKDAIAAETVVGMLSDTAKEIFSIFSSHKEEEKEGKKIDDEAVQYISQKMERTIIESKIRIVASAATTERASEILNDLTSAFNQFSLVKGNGLSFEKPKGRALLPLFRSFSYREFGPGETFPLNIKELATIFHFPAHIYSGSQLKVAKANTAPAPFGMGKEGILLGTNKHRHLQTPIYFAPEDRMRHFYVIGQTGTGKTTLLKNMIIQDIEQGHGVCMMDPHGSDIVDVLKNIPRERIDDVIYFDPSDIEYPMGLNMLEYDRRFPEQKTFVINELLSIFNKLFDMKSAGGPMFEQYFRNATLTVMEDPESGNTLLEIGRVMADREFRMKKLMRSRNPLVLQFWQGAEKTKGEQGLENFVPYITSKFDVFLSNDIMRPIVAQERSALNFRQIMDEKKILLINLSKGRLGDINAHFIGLIIVGKILMAALSRVDMTTQGLKPEDFYLYIDEFQNVTTPSIATILSEARKYRLSLTMAHQFIGQLDADIKNAVFGNVGSMATFRVGPDDAEYLEKQYEPTFTAQDILKLENRNAYMKMLLRGTPEKPFNMETIAPQPGHVSLVEEIKKRSREKYSRPRAEVEQEIIEKYKRPLATPDTQSVHTNDA